MKRPLTAACILASLVSCGPHTPDPSPGTMENNGEATPTADECEGLDYEACEANPDCEANRYEMDEPPWGGHDCLPIDR